MLRNAARAPQRAVYRGALRGGGACRLRRQRRQPRRATGHALVREETMPRARAGARRPRPRRAPRRKPLERRLAKLAEAGANCAPCVALSNSTPRSGRGPAQIVAQRRQHSPVARNVVVGWHVRFHGSTCRRRTRRASWAVGGRRCRSRALSYHTESGVPGTPECRTLSMIANASRTSRPRWEPVLLDAVGDRLIPALAPLPPSASRADRR